MSYKGDRLLGASVPFKFTSVNVSGAPTTLGGAPVVAMYVDGSLAQFVAGVTLTVDFDGVTGLNHVQVAATSGNGFAAGHDYELTLQSGSAGGVSYIGYTIGSFSIGMCTAAIADAVWDELGLDHITADTMGSLLYLTYALATTIATAIGTAGDGLTALPSNTALGNALADAFLNRASGVEASYTPKQALRLILAASAGKVSGATSATLAIRDVNDTKDRITASLDQLGNRTAITTDVT